MAITMKDVRAILDAEEPDYEALSLLGEGVLPHLQKLATGTDPMLASKATYAASLVGDGAAFEIILAAAQSDEVLVRVAAAGAARNLTTEHNSVVLETLVQDQDPGVRKVARASIADDAAESLRALAVDEAPAAEPPSLSNVNQLGGTMPGEQPAGAAEMPGRPGADPGSGLMPGETPPSGSAGDGLMPGERP